MDPGVGPTPIGSVPIVEEATAVQIASLIDVWWGSFNSDFIQRIYPQTVEGRLWLQRAFKRSLNAVPSPRDPTTKYVIVRNPEDGAPVAIAVYRIIPAGCDPERRSWRVRWSGFEDLPSIHEDILADFFDPMEKTQTYLLGDRAHIHLEALGTIEAHQKKGYGTALIKWGTNLADGMGVECYLDASPVGRPLYEANGYVVQDVSAVLEKPAGAPMVRPRKR
ncbi:uncharacterized protein F4822DRAFT_406164 [Hypoxylon trugodes]|uniref:uncharacterized protein n=1 Tax=Hypoxylon trugodes TaxID=326681 RepID=UPI0021A156EE|nr:uncharacterized protein F4822DRAFT_406164 [Hypoxylon trugodes]KAI1387332.1 hypothetical protein F4822DRAFT_406164 [Hypoxylon trugodes]